MTSTEPILIDKGEDGVAVVTLNRPDALNAADEELHGALASVWSQLAELPELRALIITGAGSAFCAGGDLPMLERMSSDPELRSRIMAEGAGIVRGMASFPLPVVAAVNGPAVGLGCSLVALSDLVVMEESAYLADPHVPLGLVAGDGGAITWPLNMGLQRVKEWLLLGGRISSAQALEFGLANRVVPDGQAVPEARKLAQQLANLPPQALRETRRILNQPLAARIETALDDIIDAESKSFDEPAFREGLARLLVRQHG